MSWSAVACIVFSSISTTRTYGRGRVPRLLADHASQIAPFASHAPVIRSSHRASQLVPSGPVATYGPAFHAETLTSCAVGAFALSGQAKTRSWVVLLWLAKYMIDFAPRTHRSAKF